MNTSRKIEFANELLRLYESWANPRKGDTYDRFQPEIKKLRRKLSVTWIPVSVIPPHSQDVLLCLQRSGNYSPKFVVGYLLNKSPLQFGPSSARKDCYPVTHWAFISPPNDDGHRYL